MFNAKEPEKKHGSIGPGTSLENSRLLLYDNNNIVHTISKVSMSKLVKLCQNYFAKRT